MPRSQDEPNAFSADLQVKVFICSRGTNFWLKYVREARTMEIELNADRLPDLFAKKRSDGFLFVSLLKP